MLSWLFETLTTIITFILSIFGIDYKKKTVSFAEDLEKNETIESDVVEPVVESVVVESVVETNTVEELSSENTSTETE